MDKKPTITVIMPAYNAEGMLAQSVESVLAQTFDDFELLIIDDGSADGTVQIAWEYAQRDDRITVLENETNQGVSYTRNRGVKAARGEWVAFLDSDDVWRADKLEKQLALTQHQPDAQLLYTASAFMDHNGNPYHYVMPALSRVDYATLLGKNLLSCSSVMIKRTLMARFPMADGTNMHEDYAVWLQILREVPYAYGIDKPLLLYRLSPHSKSGNRLRSAQMNYRAYRYVGYVPIAALMLMLRYALYSIRKRHRIKKTA